MAFVEVHRYTNETTLASPLDRLADVIVHLGFLVSADYTVNFAQIGAWRDCFRG